MQENINRPALRFLLRKELERLGHVHHDRASRDAEACFNEIVARQSERTKLLCNCAAKSFDHFAQARLELVTEKRDLGPFQNDLISYGWDWLTPFRNDPTSCGWGWPTQRLSELFSYGWAWPRRLMLAELDESENKSIKLTLIARIMFWGRVAFAKVMGGAGSSAVPEPIKPPGDTEANSVKATNQSKSKPDGTKAKERQAFMAIHIAPAPKKPSSNTLSADATIAQSSFSRWYNGHNRLSPVNLGRLADQLKVDPKTIPN